ncbi:MAG TPA: hypothetical protein PLD05_00480 [Thermogutta sp.]|nr:hypothetical protein [Thermogutta sp.]HQF12456.1 hypothetical protein [Thermogutta sp.]
MNQSPPEDQTTAASAEELGEDMESSSALISRYSFEIRVGLAILGVLGFIFAAVVAYRMIKLRQDEVNRTKPTETAQAGDPTESQTSGQSHSSAQEEASGESIAPPPPFALDFPNSFPSSAQSASSGATEASHPVRNQRAAQGWVLPPDGPAEESPLGAATSTNDPATGYAAIGDSAGTASSCAQLTPAAPVAGNTPPGFSNDSSPLYGAGQNNSSAPIHASDARVPDFFAENRSIQPSSLTPGPPIDGSPNQPGPFAGSTSRQNLEAESGIPFPGDFFAGGAALSSQGNLGGLPSSVQPAGQDPQPTSNDNRFATNNVTPTVDPFSRSSGVVNPRSQEASAGVPQGGVATTQGPSPYSPPLVASESNVGENPDPMAGNYITHTVQEGETLFDIARQRLGKASRWVDIYQLNRGQLGERLEYFRPGLILRLPADATHSTATSPTTLR